MTKKEALALFDQADDGSDLLEVLEMVQETNQPQINN
jgi:hypothetical protein